jgi:TP901 family phage tail tape measure protein
VLVLPKHTINFEHQIKGQFGDAGGPTPRNVSEPKALAAVEKGIQALPKEFRKVLVDILKPEIKKMVREIEGVVSKPSSTGSGGTISKAVWRDIAKILSDEMAKKVADAISKGSAGGGVRPTGDKSTDKIAKEIGVKLDKLSGDMVRTMDATLRKRTGEGLSPGTAREVSRIIGETIKRSVPSSAGSAIKETKELSKNLETTSKRMLELISAIKGMKSSGGGIDLSELARALKSLEGLFRDFNSFRKQLGETTKAYKDASGEIKSLKSSFDELSRDMLKLRDQYRERIKTTTTGLKDEPAKLMKETAESFKRIIPKTDQFKPLENKIDKLIDSLDSVDKLSEKIGEFRKGMEGAFRQAKGAGVDIKPLNDAVDSIERLARAAETKLSTKGIGGYQEVRPASRPVPRDVQRISKGTSGIDYRINERQEVKEAERIGKARGKAKAKAEAEEFDRELEIQRRRRSMGPARSERSTPPSRFATPQIPSYKPMLISPGKSVELKGPVKGGFGESAKKVVEENINNLSKSLKDLQEEIVNSLERAFKEQNNNWQIVREQGQKAAKDLFTPAGGAGAKQWQVQIADISKILSDIPKEIKMPKSAPSADIVKKYKEVLLDRFIKKDLGGSVENMATSIANWIKKSTSDSLTNVDLGPDLNKYLDKLKKVKEDYSQQIAVSAEMIEEISKVFANSNKDLENVLRQTAGKRFVKEQLESRNLVRNIAIPAAKTTERGGTIFETTQGSQRSLSKFATFITGLERLYDVLVSAKALDIDKEFGERIAKVGIKPKGKDLFKANQLAKEMLEEILTKVSKSIAGMSPAEFVKTSYREAALSKGTKLKQAGAIDSVADYVEKVDKIISRGDLSAGLEKFVKEMNNVGISAYDATKALDKLDFENVYDVLLKVLKGEGGKGPLQKLGERPGYSSRIRDFEKAIRQVEQLMPLTETNRPRRESHLENVVNLRSQVSDVYATEKTSLPPEKQKGLIKDLNVRLKEIFDEYKELSKELDQLEGIPSVASIIERRRKAIPTGVKGVSSLGLPESQASNIMEFSKRGGMFQKETLEEGMQYLRPLKGIGVKMYADNLRAMAPLGEEFGNMARNITGVTNALTDMNAQMAKVVGVPPEVISGIRAEFPSFRTTREEELISGGRFGKTGYGYNVIAELRHTAGTFEDQILVGGKLAEALTSAVKTIIQPSPGGRIRFQDVGTEEFSQAVGPVKEKTLQEFNKAVDQASRTFQEVLGVPQKYKGRADAAFIEEVKKAISVVRGEEIEVQSAKLAEVFLNYFGRKFTTRYGSKGVGVSPPGEVRLPDIMSAFPNMATKIQPAEEREAAVLGTAIRPKSMGRLIVEMLDKQAREAEKVLGGKKKFEELKSKLTESGNMFMLNMFKSLSKGILVPRDARKQQKLFTEVNKLMRDLYGEGLKSDITGVIRLKERYQKELKEQAKLYEETPIDVRISAYGAGKRGLQAEVLEKALGNIRGGSGSAVVPETLGPKFYKGMLQSGELSKVSKALGFKGTEAPIEKIKSDLIKRYGENSKALVDQLARLEKESAFYVDVIDELGEVRRSIVGPSFLSIVEEPGQHPAWTKRQIEAGEKGIRLNLPAFAAYETIFGKQSELMKEIKGNLDNQATEHWEYIKALQVYLSGNEELLANLNKTITEEHDISELKTFEPHTGTFDPDDLQRSLSGTIYDVEKFSKAFKLNIPSTTKPGEKEPFYIPGPLARGVYPEQLMAGEFGPKPVARRLQQVINAAKRVEDTRTQPLEELLNVEELKETLPQIVGGIARQARSLREKGGPAATKELKQIIGRLGGVLSETQTVPVEEVTAGGKWKKFSGKPIATGKKWTEKELLKTIYEDQMYRVREFNEDMNKALTTVINRAVDLIAGPKGGARSKDFVSVIDRKLAEGDKALAEFVDQLGVKNSREEAIQRALASLEKAKISYYEELAKTVIGKSGSIGKLAFNRRIPAIMGKAVSAIVDRRKELDEFTKTVKDLYGSEEFSKIFEELGFGNMKDTFSELENISKEHANIIKKQQKLGMPILGQQELGISPEFAKNLSVEFTKRFRAGERGGITAVADPKKTKSSLYDLLKYVEKLEKAMEGSEEAYQGVMAYIENELVPYVESVRFPFTGTSSVQPYKAKLLEEKVYGRNLAQNVIAAPGIPPMDIEKFETQISKFRDIRGAAFQRREQLFESGGSPEEIDKLTKLISKLDEAISNVIPKYIAHQQKLDFDGDTLEVHTAVVENARKDIKTHFDKLNQDVESAGAVWRDAFTYLEAARKQVPSSKDYPLADMGKAFTKKFAPEKGFEFMRKPYTSEQLAHLLPEEQLSVLAQSADEMAAVLKSIATETLIPGQVGSFNRLIATEAKKVAGGEPEVMAKAMIDLIDSIQKHGNVFNENTNKLIKYGIEQKLSQQKLTDAVEAQLFKIHTGPETEAFTRLSRIAEKPIGFAGGVMGSTYKSEASFRKRWPSGGALGEVPEREFHTMMNELYRFAIQSGMDVKHGVNLITKEITQALAIGGGALNNLWKSIEEADKGFEDLKDFSEHVGMSIKTRLGKLPTADIREEAANIYASRGEEFKIKSGGGFVPGSEASRKELMAAIVEKVGFKGFLEELSFQIREQAIQVLYDNIKKLPIAMQKKKTGLKEINDSALKSWAKLEVKDMMEESPVSVIRSIISEKGQPLYGYRTASANLQNQLLAYKGRMGITKGQKMDIPEFNLAGMGEAQQEAFIEKYKKAYATSRNLANTFSELASTEGSTAYHEMVKSTVEALQERQKKIEQIASSLKEYSTGGDLAERVLEGMAPALEGEKLFKPIKVTDKASLDKLKDSVRELNNRVEEYSDLAAMPLLSDPKKLEIEMGTTKRFGEMAEAMVKQSNILEETDMTFDEVVGQITDSLVERAQALYQMDKVVESFRAQGFGGLELQSIFSGKTKAQLGTGSTGFRRPSRASGYATPVVGTSGPAREERVGVPGTGIGRGGFGGGYDLVHGAVPVWIVGPPEVLSRGELRGVVETAKVGHPGMVTVEEKMSRLEELATKLTGGVNELKGGTFADIFRASGLGGGGTYKADIGTEPKRMMEQIKKMQSTMAGKEEGGLLLKASATLGTGLHEKIEEYIKTHEAANAAFEEFVAYKDEQAGIIVGHIDTLLKSEAGIPEKVIDIKTSGEGVIKNLMRITKGESVVDFTDVQDKVKGYTRQKIEEARSQINFYLKAVAEQTEGLSPEDLMGEVRFYDRMSDDPSKFVAVRFKFDPERFKKDMEAIVAARETMDGVFAATGTYEEFLQNAMARKRGEFESLTGPELKELISGSRELVTHVVGGGADPYRKDRAEIDYGKMTRTHRAEMEKAAAGFKIGKGMEYLIPPEPVPGVSLDAILENLKMLHSQAKLFHEFKGMGFEETLSKMVPDIQRLIKEAAVKGPDYEKFINTIEQLKKMDAIKGPDVLKSWKLYRMAVGDFLIAQGQKAKEQMDEAEKVADYTTAREAHASLTRSVGRMQEFVRRQIGKRTDLYTQDKVWVDPNLAKAAGVFMGPEEIAQRSAGALGDDKKLRALFDSLVSDLKEDDMASPIEKARFAFEKLADSDKDLVKLLMNAEKLKLIGPEVVEAWDFDKLVKQITKLRAALQMFLRSYATEEHAISQRRNLEDTIKILKGIENAYSSINMRVNQMERPPIWGEMGVAPVPKTIAPTEQLAMHRRNLQRIREYFSAPTGGGGPQVGERFTYNVKVFTETGQVLKNIAVDFKKYGETVDSTGRQVGLFNEKQRDLIAVMQGTTRGFKGAIERAIKWGFASRVVYGGFSQLQDAVGTLADIEMGLAQLRMVMSHVNTDFGKMQDSAVEFAKTYGVSVTDVLKGMRVFAQQGLEQAEVIERTKTATLASNVTTLTAKDATEALTAATKVFGDEITTTMRALDAWSEVEARHAITAGDMADGIKKSAAAAKNAGFTFDQLNGIIAAVGSVTRQSGKQVGTAFRFIFRRLTSEKGPKELAKIGIPSVTGSGELRKGYDILKDLAGAWDTLTSAQKMSVAQAIGGTRRYNDLLVLMDNWSEAVEAVRHSVNSKGSAERRNVEIMKTYQKQLEQVKAAATELQMSFGDMAFPFFKGALKGTKFLLESLSSIPPIVKKIGIGAVLLVTALTKGAGIVQSIGDFFSGVQYKVSDVIGKVKKEWGMAKYEMFGKGYPEDMEFLKTVGTKKIKSGVKFEVDEAGVSKAVQLFETTMHGKTMKDFHSFFGKIGYLAHAAGRSYNEFIGNFIKGTGKAVSKTGDLVENTGDLVGVIKDAKGGASTVKNLRESMGDMGFSAKNVKDTLKSEGIKGLFGKGVKLGGGPWKILIGQIIEESTDIVGSMLNKAGEKMGGLGAGFIKNFAAENAGLLKTVGPLAATIGVMAPALAEVAKHYKKITQSADEYAQSLYETQRANSQDLATIQEIRAQYEDINSILEDARQASDPRVKQIQMEQETYEAPLFKLIEAQEKAIAMSNNLAKVNSDLVVGYDNMGNAIIDTTQDLDKHIQKLQQSKAMDMVKTDLEAISRYVDDLSKPNTGLRELKRFIESIPGAGKPLGKFIEIGSFTELQDAMSDMNKLMVQKSKNPLSQTFAPFFKGFNERMLKANFDYEGVANNMKDIITKMGDASLSKEQIEDIFASEEMMKAFDILVEIDPKYKLVPFKESGNYNAFIDDSMRSAKALSEKFFDTVIPFSQLPHHVKDISFGLADTAIKKYYGMVIDKIKEAQSVSAEELAGQEIFKRVYPNLEGFIGPTKQFTQAMLETSGFAARSERKAYAGDIVTFSQDVVNAYGILGHRISIAGEQAVVKLNEADEFILEYFDERERKLKQIPYSEELQKLTERIFPVTKIKEDLSDRIQSLNTFVAGASAGLRGISPKDVRRDYNLGEMFFSEVPTSTILQTSKGFNPMTGAFGESPFQKGWDKQFNEFYAKPMAEYRRELEKVQKLRLEGLEGSVTPVKELIDNMTHLQDVLKNNQIVLQFRRAFVDLTKTIAESTRTLEENIKSERIRQEYLADVSGYMKGFVKDLGNVDLGVQTYKELTPEQRLVKTSPEFREGAKRIRESDMRINALMEQQQAVGKFDVALERISDIAKGFGAQLGKEDFDRFIREVAAGQGDRAYLEVAGKVTADNTGKLVTQADTQIDRLDSILSLMGNQEAAQRELTSIIEAGDKYGGVAESMKRVGLFREAAIDRNSPVAIASANKALNELVKSVIIERGVGGAIKFARSGELSKEGPFTSSEFLQRVMKVAGVNSDEMLKELEKRLPRKTRLGPHAVGIFATRPGLKERPEYKTIMEAREESKEKPGGILSGGDLNVIAGIITSVQTGEAMRTNDVIEKLNKDLTSLEERRIKATESGKETTTLDKEIESTKKALKEASKELKFKKLARNTAVLANTTGQLSKQFGLSDAAIKKMDGAAVSAYLGMELAAQASGKDLPEAAKDFGKQFKKVLSKHAKGESIGWIEGTDYKLAAKKMKEVYKEKVGDLPKAGKEQLKKMAEKYKSMTLDDAELVVKKNAEIIKNKAYKQVDSYKALEIALALMTVTLNNYANSLSESKTKIANAAEVSEKEMNAFTDLILENREVRKASIGFLETKVKESITPEERAAAKLKKKEVSEVLDAEKAKQEVEKQSAAITEKNAKALEKERKGRAKDADEMARIKASDVLKDETKNFDILIDSLKEAGKMALELSKNVGSIGLTAGRYKPGSVEFGPTGIGELTPEEYLSVFGLGKKNGDYFAKKLNELSTAISVREGTIDQLNEVSKEAKELAKREGKLSPYEETRLEGLRDRVDNLKENLEDQNSAITDYTNALYGPLEEVKRLQQEYASVREQAASTISSRLEEMFGQQAILNKNLIGFPGDVALPARRGELSSQQQAFTQLGDSGRKALMRYNDALLSNQYNVSRLAKLETERSQAISNMEKQIEAGSESEGVIRDRFGPDIKKYEEQIKGLTRTITENAEKIKKAGDTYRAIVSISDAMYQLRNTLRDVSIGEAINEITRDYRRGLENLYGGAGPEAPINISLAEQRRARQVGVDLRPFGATDIDRERADLRYRLTTEAMAPRQQMESIQRLADIDSGRVTRRREAEMRQAEEVDLLKAQLEPFAEQLTALERARRMPGLGEDVRNQIEEAMRYTKNLLDNAIRVEEEGGQKYFRGIKPGDIDEQQALVKAVLDKLEAGFSEMDMGKLADNFVDPIVHELTNQTFLLSALVDAEGKDPAEILKKASESLVSKLFGTRDIGGKSSGGFVKGTGTTKSDSIPAMLSNKEYVIKASSAKRLGIPILNYMNEKGELPGFASGGQVIRKKIRPEGEIRNVPLSGRIYDFIADFIPFLNYKEKAANRPMALMEESMKALDWLIPMTGGAKSAGLFSKLMKSPSKKAVADPALATKLFEHFDVHNVKSIGSSITGEAYKLGAKAAEDPKYLKSLGLFKAQTKSQWKKLMKEGDFNAAIEMGSRSQAGREAIEMFSSIRKGRPYKSIAQKDLDNILSNKTTPLSISGFASGGLVEIGKELFEKLKGGGAKVYEAIFGRSSVSAAEAARVLEENERKKHEAIMKATGEPLPKRYASGGLVEIGKEVFEKLKSGAVKAYEAIFGRSSISAAEAARVMEENEDKKHKAIMEATGEAMPRRYASGGSVRPIRPAATARVARMLDREELDPDVVKMLAHGEAITKMGSSPERISELVRKEGFNLYTKGQGLPPGIQRVDGKYTNVNIAAPEGFKTEIEKQLENLVATRTETLIRMARRDILLDGKISEFAKKGLKVLGIDSSSVKPTKLQERAFAYYGPEEFAKLIDKHDFEAKAGAAKFKRLYEDSNAPKSTKEFSPADVKPDATGRVASVPELYKGKWGITTAGIAQKAMKSPRFGLPIRGSQRMFGLEPEFMTDNLMAAFEGVNRTKRMAAGIEAYYKKLSSKEFETMRGLGVGDFTDGYTEDMVHHFDPITGLISKGAPGSIPGGIAGPRSTSVQMKGAYRAVAGGYRPKEAGKHRFIDDPDYQAKLREKQIDIIEGKIDIFNLGGSSKVQKLFGSRAAQAKEWYDIAKQVNASSADLEAARTLLSHLVWQTKVPDAKGLKSTGDSETDKTRNLSVLWNKVAGIVKSKYAPVLLNKRLEDLGERLPEDVVKYRPYGTEVKTPNWTKTSSREFEVMKAITSGDNKRIKELLEEMSKFKMKPGGREVYHSGGEIQNTGFKYLRRGEVVLPGKYAEGGPVIKSVLEKSSDALGSGLTLDSSSFESAIDDFEDAVDKLEVLISDSKIKVDTTTPIPVEVGDATVPVDTDGVTVSVDVTGASVPVDTSGAFVTVDTAGITVPIDASSLTVDLDATGAADRIANAVKYALSTGASVGADKMDSLAEALSNVNDKIITVKNDLTNLITDTVEVVGGVKANVETRVSNIEASVRRQLDSLRSQTSDVRSTTYNLSFKNESKLLSIEEEINKLKSMIMSNV